MATIALLLRFLLELGGVVAVGFAGHELAGDGPARWLAAIGAGGGLVLLWAAVAAPSTANGLSQAQKDVIGTAILLVAAVALAAAGQAVPAIGFGTLVVADAALLVIVGTDARAQLAGLSR